MLTQGVDAWNAWRRDNPDASPDLNGVNLSTADLIKATLREASLLGANLKRLGPPCAP